MIKYIPIYAINIGLILILVSKQVVLNLIKDYKIDQIIIKKEKGKKERTKVKRRKEEEERLK